MHIHPPEALKHFKKTLEVWQGFPLLLLSDLGYGFGDCSQLDWRDRYFVSTSTGFSFPLETDSLCFERAPL